MANEKKLYAPMPLPVPPQATSTPPADQFAQYATPVRAGPPRVVVVRGRTPWSRRYRSELARQARGRVNFAGRYVLAQIGCGAGCLTLGAVDRWNGAVMELAPTICCWPEPVTEPLRYRANSRLLVAQGLLNETGAAGFHRFVLRHGRFEQLPDGQEGGGGVATRRTAPAFERRGRGVVAGVDPRDE